MKAQALQNSAPGLAVWRAAGYSRISREDGDKDESDSISNQKELIRSFALDKTDIALTDGYEDDGYTGVNFDRPGFKRMIEDIKGGKINCVIVKDLSRLGRNYIETGKLLERIFPFMGVRFIAVTDAYDSQSHNAQTDNLIIPLKNLINDAYCADISKKIRSQFEVRRMGGDYLGAFAAYGYTKDPSRKNHLAVDEETAPVVSDIFRWKIAGMSQQGIADKLNALGVSSPLEQKRASGSKYVTAFSVNARAKWTAVAVGRILRNDLYTGVLTQGVSTTPNYKIKQRVQRPEAEWARIEDAHEAIIPLEDFTLVERLLKKDTRIAPGGDGVYVFSGLLYCGGCGRSLVLKPVRNSGYAYFVCSTHKKGEGCSSHSISEKLIHDAVLQTLTLHVKQCAELARLMEFIDGMPLRKAEALKLQKRMEQKQAEIDKLAARRIRLYEDYADGVMAIGEYKRFNAAFEAQAAEAGSAMDALRDELEIAASGSGKHEWIDHFKKHSDLRCLTRATVVELIDHITVHDSKKIKIAIRYQDEFEAALSCLESFPCETAEGLVV